MSSYDVVSDAITKMDVSSDRNHGIAGGNLRLHLYWQMTNFVLQHL